MSSKNVRLELRVFSLEWRIPLLDYCSKELVIAVTADPISSVGVSESVFGIVGFCDGTGA
jgi:hypothetical protein